MPPIASPANLADPNPSLPVQDCDDDTLVMLSRGVAYAGGGHTVSLVKQLYQQVGETRP